MNNEPSQFITIAKIGAPHGVRGDLKLNPFTDDLQKITQYQDWFIENASSSEPWQPIKLSFKSVHQAILIHIPGCDDREKAKTYVNKQLAIKREALASLKDTKQYYWADLEGCSVVTTEGQLLGIIDCLLETGANDIMVIKGEREHLVPFLDHVVLEVDFDKQKITVDWDPDY